MSRLVAAFLFMGGAAFAQGEPPPAPEHEHLAPSEAMKMLHEVQDLMTLSEDLLNESSRGKTLATEQELLKRIESLLKESPSEAQKSALEQIRSLLSSSDRSQKDAVDRLAQILRKAKT